MTLEKGGTSVRVPPEDGWYATARVLDGRIRTLNLHTHPDRRPGVTINLHIGKSSGLSASHSGPLPGGGVDIVVSPSGDPWVYDPGAVSYHSDRSSDDSPRYPLPAVVRFQELSETHLIGTITGLFYENLLGGGNDPASRANVKIDFVARVCYGPPGARCDTPP